MLPRFGDTIMSVTGKYAYANVDYVQHHLARVVYTVLVRKCVKVRYSLAVDSMLASSSGLSHRVME